MTLLPLRTLRSLCFAVICLGGTSANADENGRPAVNSPHATSLSEHVDGAINPEKVPDFMKYHVFFSGYEAAYRDVLLPQLSADDDALLRRAASRAEDTQRSAGRNYEARLRKLCTSGSSTDYVALVQERERLARESNEQVGAYYRRVLGELSPSGRTVVEQLVASDVTPGIVTGLPNTDNWFKDDNEGARENFELSCYVAINGRYPEHIQEQMDEDVERARQEGRKRLEQLRDELSAGED